MTELWKKNYFMFTLVIHVRAFVQENVKPFLKSLVSYVSHRDQMMVLFALCLLTSLCLHEELGQKVSYVSHRDQMMVLFALCLLTSLCLHEELGQKVSTCRTETR